MRPSYITAMRSAMFQARPRSCVTFFWPELVPPCSIAASCALGHIRGGGEGGRSWWLQGRPTAKRTTFTDFVSCARHLVDAGRTEPAMLAARGISAGGLLMGAAHLAPEVFGLVIAEVPFVDVVNTMLDDTLPLTVADWGRVGRPARPGALHVPAVLLGVREPPRPAPAGSPGHCQSQRPTWSALTSRPSGSRRSVLRMPHAGGCGGG